jgi:hypothetical protein
MCASNCSTNASVAASDGGVAAAQRSGCTLAGGAAAGGDAVAEPHNKSAAATVKTGYEGTKFSFTSTHGDFAQRLGRNGPRLKFHKHESDITICNIYIFDDLGTASSTAAIVLGIEAYRIKKNSVSAVK